MKSLIRRWAFMVLIKTCGGNIVLRQRLCSVVDDIGFGANDLLLCTKSYCEMNKAISELTKNIDKGENPFLTTDKGGF